MNKTRCKVALYGTSVIIALASGTAEQTLALRVRMPLAALQNKSHKVEKQIAAASRTKPGVRPIALPSQARYEGRDETTQGNWISPGGQIRYGAEGFLIPVINGRSVFSIPGVQMQRGNGRVKGPHPGFGGFPVLDEESDVLASLESGHSMTTRDPRVPLRGPGTTERAPVAFAAPIGRTMLFRVDAPSTPLRRLSLYFLDARRSGQAYTVTLSDLHGQTLDTRRVTKLNSGVYVRYRMAGSVLIAITPLSQQPAMLSGIFLDPIAAPLRRP